MFQKDILLVIYTFSVNLQSWSKGTEIAHNFVSAAFLCSGIEMLSEIVRLIYGKREHASACLIDFLPNIIKYIKYFINEDDDPT